MGGGRGNLGDQGGYCDGRDYNQIETTRTTTMLVRKSGKISERFSIYNYWRLTTGSEGR